MECGLPGSFMLVVSKNFSGGDRSCDEIANTIQPGTGLGFHSSANEDVDNYALWLALLDEVRQPEARRIVW